MTPSPLERRLLQHLRDEGTLHGLGELAGLDERQVKRAVIGCHVQGWVEHRPGDVGITEAGRLALEKPA